MTLCETQECNIEYNYLRLLAVAESRVNELNNHSNKILAPIIIYSESHREVKSRGIINSHCYIENSSLEYMNDKGKANVARKSALKLALLFTFVGMMMILIPMLTEKAEARTQGKAVLGPLITISNLKYQLDQGKWSVIPHIIGSTDSPIILWETKGSGFFGGPERGSVEVDIKFRNNLAHAKFSWYNPDSGQNSCNVQITGSHAAYFGGICTIPPHGTFVDAFYLITPDY